MVSWYLLIGQYLYHVTSQLPELKGSVVEQCVIKLTWSLFPTTPQNLEDVMQPTRDVMEWPLSQMDREVGISFNSNFHFSLSALLFKGFSHPLSTVRTRTQELLTTVFFLHSSEGCLGWVV